MCGRFDDIQPLAALSALLYMISWPSVKWTQFQTAIIGRSAFLSGNLQWQLNPRSKVWAGPLPGTAKDIWIKLLHTRAQNKKCNKLIKITRPGPWQIHRYSSAFDRWRSPVISFLVCGHDPQLHWTQFTILNINVSKREWPQLTAETVQLDRRSPVANPGRIFLPFWFLFRMTIAGWHDVFRGNLGIHALIRSLYVRKAVKKWRNWECRGHIDSPLQNLANSKAIELVRFLEIDDLDRIVWGPSGVEMETAHIIENLTDQLSEIYWDVINFFERDPPQHWSSANFLNKHFQCGTVKPVKELSSNTRHGNRILLSKVRPMPFFVFWGALFHLTRRNGPRRGNYSVLFQGIIATGTRKYPTLGTISDC
jgi:hypothetical protein